MHFEDDSLGRIRRLTVRDDEIKDAVVSIYAWEDCSDLQQPLRIRLTAGVGYDYEASRLTSHEARAIAAELLAAADILDQLNDNPGSRDGVHGHLP